ncbi:MAG: FKBP-type peptidyl-prolyl cis-trans isomerase, partial [Bacteroidales bacterium]|nr:FKBP-type peptidyl-prolyl cis-trans isomerase [Bacteroidales bacterium]
MKAEKNNVVSLTYELRISGKDGEVIDAAVENQPLDFIYGSGMMLPKFEENLANLKADDSFDFMLTAEEGYGVSAEENVDNIHTHLFQLHNQNSQ